MCQQVLAAWHVTCRSRNKILALTVIHSSCEDLHPTTQSLFIDAASRIHIAHGLFNQGGDSRYWCNSLFP